MNSEGYSIDEKISLSLERGCLNLLKHIDTISYIYMCYKQWYYIGMPIASDEEFDKLEDVIKELWPTNPVLQIVGKLDAKCTCCRSKNADRDNAVRWENSKRRLAGQTSLPKPATKSDRTN